ncbi:hypothetical protein FNO01nite_09700 [Flavobacterium noncentrifugens]|uniref:hypothetical protein n=1 Tax=Flavobacterium noncentrifugens TaxID=1128970 RepID=UPI000B82C10A|nr:hypothetical protein [Flavobacterium noncentrifugens]GEP50298.1 hypothetical protein FNO01nite_09700 [Flavobacterium noncentrifugens]
MGMLKFTAGSQKYIQRIFNAILSDEMTFWRYCPSPDGSGILLRHSTAEPEKIERTAGNASDKRK